MQLGVEFVDLTAVSIPVELVSYVPKNIAKKFCVVPVKLVKDTLYLAMSDPLDFVAQEEVKVASRKRVIPMIATRRTTEHAISLLYGSEGTAGVIEEMKCEAGSSTPDIVPVQVSQEAMNSGDSAPTIRSTASLNARFPSARAISTWSRRTAKWSCVCVSTVFCAACLRSPPNCRAPSSRASRSWGHEHCRAYRRIFDIARLVDPGICVELTKRDEGYTLKKSEHCYAVWKKKRRCENCISQEVLRTHKPQTKLETRASDIYYVLASFIEVDGRPYSLELVKRIKSDDMFERENVLNQLLVRDRQVYMDSVTKVYNRRYYDERLKNLEGRFSFAMIDMDNFKHINDRFGHQAGDAALYRAAQAIKSQIRSDDELVRYGGDEFFLLFRDLPQQILEKKLQSIRAALDEIVIEEYPELHISASIGGAFAAGRISRTIHMADLAMYQAKLKKDCVAIYREAKERET